MIKLKRYLVFLLGLFISSFGVSFITRSNLGTSPISSVPYVLSLNFSWSLGEFTIAFSVLLILLQILILRKNFRLEHLLQIPISIAFGYFIDLTMILLSSLNPSSYLIKLVCLIFGCVILGFGVYLEVLADVAMLPGESFVRAVTSTWNTDFGMTKVAFDVTITVSAVVLSFLFAHQLEGIEKLFSNCRSAGWFYCTAVWFQISFSALFYLKSLPFHLKTQQINFFDILISLIIYIFFHLDKKSCMESHTALLCFIYA